MGLPQLVQTTFLGCSEASMRRLLPSSLLPQRAALSLHQCLSFQTFFSILPFPPARRQESVQALDKERLAPVRSVLFRNLPQARNSSLHSQGGRLRDNVGLSLRPADDGSRRHFLSLRVKRPPLKRSRLELAECPARTRHRALYSVCCFTPSSPSF